MISVYANIYRLHLDKNLLFFWRFKFKRIYLSRMLSFITLNFLMLYIFPGVLFKLHLRNKESKYDDRTYIFIERTYSPVSDDAKFINSLLKFSIAIFFLFLSETRIGV
jgi:hypothetical protein